MSKIKEKHKPVGIALVMPFQAQVAVFDNFKSRCKYYKKVLKFDISHHGPKGRAVASYDQDDNGIYWYALCIPDDCNLGTVVHECSHMIDFMFETHGVPGGIESTEIRAYMLGVLFMDVCEILKRPIDAV